MRVHGQGHVPDREDGVGAVRVHAELTGRRHGEAGAGPPGEARRRRRSGLPHRFHRDGAVDAGQAAQLFGQHLGLEAALALQGDVAEFGAAHGRVAVRPGAHGVRQVPEVLHPVGGSRQDLDDVAAPELGVRAGLREADPDLFAGDAVADEHHASFMPGHAVPAVGDRPDVDGQFGVGLRLGLGTHWMSCSLLASSDDFSCHGTLATITPGSKCSRVLMRSAVWLCTSCSHHLPTTYSGM